jgi:hypothetical protein
LAPMVVRIVSVFMVLPLDRKCRNGGRWFKSNFLIAAGEGSSAPEGVAQLAWRHQAIMRILGDVVTLLVVFRIWEESDVRDQKPVVSPSTGSG